MKNKIENRITDSVNPIILEDLLAIAEASLPWSELSGKGIDLLGPFDGHCDWLHFLDLFEVTVMDTKHVDHSGVVPELVKSEVGIMPEGTGDVLLCN